MRTVVVFTSVLLSATALWAQAPIIDMHIHAFELQAVSGPSGCQPQPCESLPPPVGSSTAFEGTLEAMDQYNIVLGFVNGSRLEDVYSWVEAAPNRFIASPRPVDTRLDPEEWIDPEALRREYQAGRLQGMGELGTTYFGIPPSDPLFSPYFALAEEFDVPVLIHLEGIGAPSPAFRISAGHPEQLEEVLRRHPALRIYLENAGFPFLDETIALMYTFPQVYADLSTITWLIPRRQFYSYFQSLLDAGLGERLMFGSDTENRPQVIGAGIEAIESAPFLTAEQKRNIFYNNAATFLRLSDEEITAHHR